MCYGPQTKDDQKNWLHDFAKFGRQCNPSGEEVGKSTSHHGQIEASNVCGRLKMAAVNVAITFNKASWWMWGWASIVITPHDITTPKLINLHCNSHAMKTWMLHWRWATNDTARDGAVTVRSTPDFWMPWTLLHFIPNCGLRWMEPWGFFAGRTLTSSHWFLQWHCCCCLLLTFTVQNGDSHAFWLVLAWSQERTLWLHEQPTSATGAPTQTTHTKQCKLHGRCHLGMKNVLTVFTTKPDFSR